MELTLYHSCWDIVMLSGKWCNHYGTILSYTLFLHSDPVQAHNYCIARKVLSSYFFLFNLSCDFDRAFSFRITTTSSAWRAVPSTPRVHSSPPCHVWSTKPFLCVFVSFTAPGKAGSAAEIRSFHTPCASHRAFNSPVKCHSPTCPVHWTSEICQTRFLLDINQHHFRELYAASLSKEWASKQVKIKNRLSGETAFKYSWGVLLWAPLSIE